MMIDRERQTSLTFAVIASLLPAVTTTAYMMARAGLVGGVHAPLLTLGVAFFVLFAPHFLAFRVVLMPEQLIRIALIGLLASAGSLIQQHASAVLYGIVPVGYTLAVVAWLRWLRGRDKGDTLMLVGAGLVSLFVMATIYSEYLDPLLPERVWLGTARKDTLFHISIANMIQGYGVVSTGLDGLVPIGYHVGSHTLFAQLALTLDTPVWQSYNLIYPVVIVPLFFHAVVTFAWRVARIRDGDAILLPDFRFWGITSLVIVDVLPLFMRSALIVVDSHILSESYGVALWLLLASGELALRVSQRAIDHTRPYTRGLSAIWLAGLPIVIYLISMTKISVGFVALAVLGYAGLRTGLYRRWQAVIGAGLAAAAFVIAFRYTSDTGYSAFKLFAILQDYIPLVLVPLFFISHYSWLAVYSLLRIRLLRRDSVPSQWRTFDLEILWVCAGVATLPAMLLSIPGASGMYFLITHKWLVVPFLLSLTLQPPARSSSRSKKYPRGIIWQFAVACVVLYCGGIIVGRVGQFGLVVQRTRAAIHANLYPEQRSITTALREVAAMPDLERQRTMVWIPQSTTAYWGMRYQDCAILPFVAPALTGLAMVDGLPNDCAAEYYGYHAYRPRSPLQTKINDVCETARTYGADRLLIVEQPDEARSGWLRMQSCS